MNKVALYSSILIFASACAPLRKTPSINPDRITLNENNLSLLNGTYNVNQAKPDEDDLLWVFFVIAQEPGDRVRLEIIKDNQLKVTVLTSAKIERTKKYRGKIENGQFVINGITQFYPCIMFNLYRKRKARLSVAKNGDLVVDSRISGFGLSLMLPIPFFFNERSYDQIFKKI